MLSLLFQRGLRRPNKFRRYDEGALCKWEELWTEILVTGSNGTNNDP